MSASRKVCCKLAVPGQYCNVFTAVNYRNASLMLFDIFSQVSYFRVRLGAYHQSAELNSAQLRV
jgi:hypothetical protein